ncbi:uncharacterized protein LOC130276215 [Hyla sarda]|uniref:uncharacterized protein LOC130276215 n=1 Tax=Hyla sarda TaxID=327740 RepID=UPI0024C2489B|nr:uncharacterized protein LOC130276215 [Hyla sarda]XP_056381224.1 uncharacterized protein LOC130276215 [Hyla sarda]
MCEKLEWCRKELFAAIQTALKGPLPPAITHLLHTHSSLIPCTDGSIGLTSTIGPLAEAHCDHPVDICKPYSEGQDNMPHSCIKWSSKKNLVSEAFHSSLLDCGNVPQDLNLPDITRDLLDIIESTSSPVMAEISQNLDWSEASTFSLDVLNRTKDERPPTAKAITESAPGTDQVIEIVLDLEDDYNILEGISNVLQTGTYD